jgi:hypothetical protein
VQCPEKSGSLADACPCSDSTETDHGPERIPFASPHTALIPARAGIQECNRWLGNFYTGFPLARGRAEPRAIQYARDKLWALRLSAILFENQFPLFGIVR